MYRIIFSLLLFVILPDLYIFLVHIRPATRRRWIRLCWWLPSLLLVVGYALLLHTGPNAMAEHTQALGWMAVLTLLCAVPKTLFMLCSLVGVLVHAVIRRCPRRPFFVAGMLLALVCLCSTLYGALFGITRFETKEVTYSSPRLPEGFDGYRIVQLSDLHIGSFRGKEKAVRRLVEKVNALHPDLIVFTGDLVNQRACELDGFQEILSRLHATDGVYSILGNHDYGTYYRWDSPQAEADNLNTLKELQHRMGWKLLNNEHVILHHRGDSIALVGVENDGEPPFSQHADLPRALDGTDGLFKLLLSHNPTHWRREVLPQSDVDLMLAGHTHAMQLILFGRSPAVWKYPEWGGMYREGGQSLYVNIGIGHVGLPLRLGAWPEITVLRLATEKEQ